MKSMVPIATKLLKELGMQHSVRTTRDELTLVARTEREGSSFLTITLPKFEKDLLRSIERGSIASDAFMGFSRDASGLPRFLGGFLKLIFAPDGTIKDTDSRGLAWVLRDIRQLLLLFSKVTIPCTELRNSAALASYVSVDAGIRPIDPNMLNAFKEEARNLHPYFWDVERDILEKEDPFRHSSGALATRETYNGRFNNNTWTERLQGVLPFWDYLHYTWRKDDPNIIPVGQEPPVKVTLVPKTQKTPRVIAMEPCWQQFVQQGVLQTMTRALARPKYRRLYEAVCWKDQEFNRELSRQGSVDGSYATIDLSEASDRVSVQLFEALLPDGILKDIIRASRSETAEVDGEVIRLKKFASMGSSMCFPIETLVFFTIVSMGIRRTSNAVNRRGVIKTPCRVYGDDLIVPTESAEEVIRLLEVFGLKINTNKTFRQSMFRESCGADWYAGHDVSVVKARIPVSVASNRDAALVKVIAWHNALFERGYVLACEEIRETLLRGIYVPHKLPGQSGDALLSWNGPQRTRFNKNLQVLERQVIHVEKVLDRDPLDGYGAVEKYFRMRGKEPLPEGHLDRDGRPRSVNAKIGWTGLE